MERASLVELEQNYFFKVGLITEQQLALEEAAMKGRDHLSWEEAEELASQEEACRAQLDQLHQTWNQRDLRTSSLIKRESDIKNALATSAHHFHSLVGVKEERELRVSKSKVLLSMLVKPFTDLESIDKVFSSFGFTSHSNEISNLADLMSSGYPISEYVWKFGSSLNHHSFFVWKLGVIDSFLDSCLNDVASSVDQTLGFDQLYNVVKRKLEMQLQEHLGRYLKERVGPSLLACIDKENERLKQLTEATKEVSLDQVKRDVGALKRVQLMLEEFCNAHETARAARVAASLMNKQVNELREALWKTGLEIVQLEWMHDATLNPSHSSRVMFQKFLSGDDSLYPIVLKLSRPNVLESLQSAVSKIARSMESLQALSILEFEASRDGIFHSPGEIYPFRTSADGRTWQQAYLNALKRLDITYHSFARTEQEWKVAERTMETASSGLSSATNELSVASLRAKSASGDLQSTVLAMSDCACEASVALSAYARVSNRHSALTSECGSMLEEVLAITEDLHDVHSLGKEAAAVHCSLVQELSKANAILLPLETVLSKDVAAMTDAMARERENNMEISPIHGQAIYQSYSLRIREARQAIEPLVPSLTSSVKGLYSMLTRLARTASLHAGNLHKALEGLGESQEVESPVIDVSRPDLAADATGFDEKGGEREPLHVKCFNDPEDIGQQLLLGPSQQRGYRLSKYRSITLKVITKKSQILRSLNQSTQRLITFILFLSSQHYSDPNEYPQAVASPNDESATVGPEISRAGVKPLRNVVLRRVEMKLDGRDIAENREISISGPSRLST
ncbi:hypothetical protein L3X38_043583 [Prunus dulcis]|uniref:Uncharacterized protein n=1 Tax=Prunus dulcis TaxID=3755 RepID=A0AAD4YLE3_PRUDU|nr:hypothetical protein L3X38_043583 [Prunus dulcis]